MSEERILTNADVKEILLAVPEGHQHLRATIRLQTGETITLQEATVANLVRAYVTLRTHPRKENVRLIGRQLENSEKKPGYATWQLLEEDRS